MKIALVHCYYQQRGGEDAVFEQEKKLLETSMEVCTFTFHNSSGLKGFVDFFLSLYNPFVLKSFRSFLQQEKPDLVHIHNWHYAIGPVVIRTAKSYSIPVVHTLHNYRLLCPSATLLDHGQPFTDSLYVSFPWKAVRKGLYRNSVLQTLWMAFIIWYNKLIGTWNQVDRYIVLTPAMKELFLKSKLGIPPHKFVEKPNFSTRPPEVEEQHYQENYFLFVGRLSEEKGIKMLLDTFAQLNDSLWLVGEGPLRPEVEEACAKHGNIRYLGALPREKILALMAQSEALIFPSIWHEPFGLVLVEALSMGCVIIASNIGSASRIITHAENGLHFEPRNSTALKEQLAHWKSLSTEERARMRNNCKTLYLQNYTPEVAETQLCALYKSLIPKEDERTNKL